MQKLRFEYWKKEGHDPEIELQLEGYTDHHVAYILTKLTEMILKIKGDK